MSSELSLMRAYFFPLIGKEAVYYTIFDTINTFISYDDTSTCLSHLNSGVEQSGNSSGSYPEGQRFKSSPRHQLHKVKSPVDF